MTARQPLVDDSGATPADSVWLSAPCAALGLWREPLRWRLNPAAAEWAMARGVTDAHWQRGVEALSALIASGSGKGEISIGADHTGLHWNATVADAAAASWLVWLQPAAPPVTAPDGTRLTELSRQLDLAQQFGRMGLIERDLRSDSGRWSPNVFALFGFDPVLGTPKFDVALQRVHPDDRARALADHGRFIAQAGRYETRFRIVRPDGEVRHVHSQIEVATGADGHPQFMTGVLIDDTDWVTRQHAQGESNAQLATTLELTGLSVWRIDPAIRRIRFNSAGYRAMGLSADTPDLGLDELRDTVHPADRDAIVAAAEAALQQPGPVDVTARYRNADGSYRTLLTRRVAQRDAQGALVATLGVSFDISAEVAERERTRALALSMELVSDAAGVGLWSLDPQTGRVEWNAQMFRLYGMSQREGAPPAATWMGERVHPEDRKRVAAQRRRAAEAGAPGFETDFRIRQPDGSWRWVACRSRRAERDGQPVLYGIHLDITEAKLAEQALRDKAAAEQASKAKSEFLAHMSHELRTPLNAVLGFSQLIATDIATPLNAVQRQRLQRIEEAGRHLLALIDDVLDLAAIEAGSLPVASEAVAIDTALRDVLEWIEPLAAAAEVNVEVDLSAGLGASARGDPRRLRQVLANLLSNGIKYNKRQGTVRVVVDSQTQQGVAGWRVRVTDDGPGLTAVQKERLFEPFNRLGAERGSVAGTGIGLTIARHLVERMAGVLEVDSEAGQGCEFRVWLAAAGPSAEGAARAANGALPPSLASRAPAATPADATQRLTMLYIEDNPVNLLLVQELTARRPLVALTTANDGASGVAQALAMPPDVLLVDIQLPDIDGFEVLRRLREAPALQATVMIALSANAMPDDMARARAEGFADYWTKPIDFSQFLGALDALIARRHPAQASAGQVQAG